MSIGKKAVSPLIATVLLVMMTVSIGAAVMVVIQGISEGSIQSGDAQQQLIKCSSDVDLAIERTSTSYMVCFNSSLSGDRGQFGIVLDNRGLLDIQDWRLTVLSNNVTDISSAGDALPKGVIGRYRFEFPIDGNVLKIRLSPKITGGANNPLITCSLPSLEWDEDEIASMTNCTEASWVSNIPLSNQWP